MENYYTKPFHELQGLDEIRLGKVEQGLGIGVQAFDNHIKWKQGQFNILAYSLCNFTKANLHFEIFT